MTGWIKLHRSIQDHWMFDFSEPDKMLAWIDLLLSAKHSSGMVNYGGRPLYLERGDVGMSQVTLQKRWGWSQNKVKRFLKALKKELMIEFKTNDLTTIISICNYDSFQSGKADDERPNERPVERGSNDQSNDKQECKNGKKEKIPTLPAKADNDVAEIFNYWKKVMHKNGSTKCTPKRTSCIKARIKEGYTIAQIKKAIDGCSKSAHHMGNNNQGTIYNDIELICRSGEKIENFSENIGSGGPSRPWEPSSI